MIEPSDLPAPFRHIAFDRIGSTNDEARRLALSEESADLLVVTAAEQSAGRGRRGRVWVSPPGNLHLSILLKLDRPLAEAAQAGFVAAAALCEALSDVAPGLDFRCKWPNDVLCGGRKIAGMLLEPTGNGWLVLGLGVDVAVAPPAGEVLTPAVSLAEAGCHTDAGTVLAAFCTRFGPWVARWRAEGFAAVRAGWLAHSCGLGQPAIVRLERETLTGTFAGLDEQGGFLLDQGTVGTTRILAGDVFFPGA